MCCAKIALMEKRPDYRGSDEGFWGTPEDRLYKAVVLAAMCGVKVYPINPDQQPVAQSTCKN